MMKILLLLPQSLLYMPCCHASSQISLKMVGAQSLVSLSTSGISCSL